MAWKGHTWSSVLLLRSRLVTSAGLEVKLDFFNSMIFPVSCSLQHRCFVTVGCHHLTGSQNNRVSSYFFLANTTSSVGFDSILCVIAQVMVFFYSPNLWATSAIEIVKLGEEIMGTNNCRLAGTSSPKVGILLKWQAVILRWSTVPWLLADQLHQDQLWIGYR